jgi:hypothetical protein
MNRFAKIEADLLLLKWMTGTAVVLLLGGFGIIARLILDCIASRMVCMMRAIIIVAVLAISTAAVAMATRASPKALPAQMWCGACR